MLWNHEILQLQQLIALKMSELKSNIEQTLPKKFSDLLL